MPHLVSNKRCDLCDQNRFELIGRLDRKGQPLDTEVCTACGLVAHRHVPTEAELNQFYATEYRQQYHGEKTPSFRRVMRAWNNGQRIYSQLSPWISPKQKVFEVGAGIGCTLKVFEKQGYSATGIEPNEGFESYSREKLHVSVQKQLLFDLPPEPAYDLVLLVHVIEHFRSPRAALSHIHRLIKPGGLLYVECPNLGASATLGRMFHFAHIHNFTPTTLQVMANACGFELVHWFTNPHGRNLEVLLRRTDQPRLSIPADAYQRTMAALHRYNLLTYHCRWEYVAPRFLQLAKWGWEWVASPAYVRSLLRATAQ